MPEEDVQEEMLTELRKIRAAVTPKAPPPPYEPEGFWEEFKAFIGKSNFIDLALAVIVGSAAGKLVSAIVEDVFMPVIAYFIPDGAWREAEFIVGNIHIKTGHLAGVALDFLIISL
jgi:large conductance mechanosensitive channel